MSHSYNTKWIDCPFHPGHPCEVLSLTSQIHPPLYCVRCIVSDKFRPSDLVMLEDIMKCNEKTYVPNWPPFENQQKMFERLQEVKVYNETLHTATVRLKQFMDEFKVQVCEAIDNLYQEITSEMNKKVDLDLEVMRVYHQVSSLSELKREVERLGSLMTSKGPSKLTDKTEWDALREQIGKKTAQREYNTKKMQEALETFRKQKLSLDTETLDGIKGYVIDQVKRMSQFGWRSEATDQMIHERATAASTMPLDKVGEVMKLITNSTTTLGNDSFLKQVEECLRRHSLVLDQIDFTSIRKTANKELESPFLLNKQHRNDIFNYNGNNPTPNNLFPSNCNSSTNFNSTNSNVNQNNNNYDNKDNNNFYNNQNQNNYNNNNNNNVNANPKNNNQKINSLVVNNNNSNGPPLNSLCLIGRSSQPQQCIEGSTNLLPYSELVKTILNQTETDTEIGRDNLGHLFVMKINSDSRVSVRMKDPINNNMKYIARFIFDRRKGSRQNFYLFVGLLSSNVANTDWSNNSKSVIFCNTKDVGVSKVLKGHLLSHQDVRSHYQEVEIRFCVKDRYFICLDYPEYNNICGLKSDEKLRLVDEQQYYLSFLLYLAGNEISITHFSTVDDFPPL